MRTIFYLAIVLLLSCNRKQPNEKIIAKNDTLSTITDTVIELPKSKLERAKYHTDKDSVCISSTAKDTLKFSKDEFNDIVDNFPELTSLNTKDPDVAYYSKVFVVLKDSTGEERHLSFNSEVGQDGYYVLYAYFLKQKNGIAKYAVRRKKLLEIYRILNSIFGNLNHGGTYYGHQYRRIEGYAEFSVYWYKHYEDYFDRPYDISKQKAFYIGGLKQLIVDEIKNDDGTFSLKEKAAHQKDLLKKADDLDKLITDNFYLRMAKSFQSDHY